MPTTQTTLIASDTDDTDDSPSRAAPTQSADHTTLAPPDQRGGQDCCPWCLAAPEAFEYHENGQVGCGYCDAVIPTETAWFKRGEKIVV